MKQGTGNKIHAITGKELSIQITLSGFSFCIAQNRVVQYRVDCDHFDFASAPGFTDDFDAVFVGWATQDVQLIPAEVFQDQCKELYMQAANMYAPHSIVLHNDTMDVQRVAVWSVDKAIYHQIDALFNNAYHFHNLQADVVRTPTESLMITLCNGFANLVVNSAQGLQAAETIEDTIPSNLLYYAVKLNYSDHFSRHKLIFTAQDCDEYMELFGRSFPDAEFINNDNVYHNIVLRCE